MSDPDRRTYVLTGRGEPPSAEVRAAEEPLECDAARHDASGVHAPR